MRDEGLGGMARWRASTPACDCRRSQTVRNSSCVLAEEREVGLLPAAPGRWKLPLRAEVVKAPGGQWAHRSWRRSRDHIARAPAAVEKDELEVVARKGWQTETPPAAERPPDAGKDPPAAGTVVAVGTTVPAGKGTIAAGCWQTGFGAKGVWRKGGFESSY